MIGRKVPGLDYGFDREIHRCRHSGASRKARSFDRYSARRMDRRYQNKIVKEDTE